MKMAELHELLQQCRENLGSPPRNLRAEEQQTFRLQPSLFMRFILLISFDKLRTVLRDQHLLRDHGRVVWGFLVQANQVLFDPTNRQTLPANVIYSPDTWFDDQAPLLMEVAQGLFSLKGTAPNDPELEKFANAITDELARTMRLRLPRSITEGREAYFTTCFIQPSHLPGGCLAAGFFPLLICPEKTEAVMILPERYWPEELRALWSGTEE
jgi:hypothetical protein